MTSSAYEWIPEGGGVRGLAQALPCCRACELWSDAIQVVPGRGPARAELMLVGEQPGDIEDQEGEPFVGPAGKLLRDVLSGEGLDPASVYLTNAVKHFRHRGTRGKRRIHQRPAVRHISACAPWLAEEINRVKPRGVVVLGAVAASAVLGPDFKVTAERGRILPWPDEQARRPVWVLATVHPSAVLRSENRLEERARFADDLRVAIEELAS
ncbi:MAG: UdgX family uracil-DNA binding protein [Marmoricola sp.]